MSLPGTNLPPFFLAPRPNQANGPKGAKAKGAKAKESKPKDAKPASPSARRAALQASQRQHKQRHQAIHYVAYSDCAFLALLIAAQHLDPNMLLPIEDETLEHANLQLERHVLVRLLSFVVQRHHILLFARKVGDEKRIILHCYCEVFDE